VAECGELSAITAAGVTPRYPSRTVISYGNSGCLYVPGVASSSTTRTPIGSIPVSRSVGYHSPPTGRTTNHAARLPTHANDSLGEPHADSPTDAVSHSTRASGSGAGRPVFVRLAIGWLLSTGAAVGGSGTHTCCSRCQQHRSLGRGNLERPRPLRRLVQFVDDHLVVRS